MNAVVDGPLRRSASDLPECRSDWGIASFNVGNISPSAGSEMLLSQSTMVDHALMQLP